jgi:hypothetical protein
MALRGAVTSLRAAITAVIPNIAAQMMEQRTEKYNNVIAILSLSQISYIDNKKLPAGTPVPLNKVKADIEASLYSNIAFGIDFQSICDSINEVIDDLQSSGGNLPSLFGGIPLNTLIAQDTVHGDWHIH